MPELSIAKVDSGPPAPNAMRSPSRSFIGFEIFLPLSSVPFDEPVSASRYVSPSNRISA